MRKIVSWHFCAKNCKKSLFIDFRSDGKIFLPNQFWHQETSCLGKNGTSTNDVTYFGDNWASLSILRRYNSFVLSQNLKFMSGLLFSPCPLSLILKKPSLDPGYPIKDVRIKNRRATCRQSSRPRFYCYVSVAVSDQYIRDRVTGNLQLIVVINVFSY